MGKKGNKNIELYLQLSYLTNFITTKRIIVHMERGTHTCIYYKMRMIWVETFNDMLNLILLFNSLNLCEQTNMNNTEFMVS